MNYLNSANIILHPKRSRNEKQIPATGLLFVNPTEARDAENVVVRKGGTKRFLFNSALCVSGDETFFVAGPAVGAPMAVLSMEKLIVLGARRIVLAGWCGALQPDLKVGDIILARQALCGEGTSQYYSQDREPEPAENLLSWLRDGLRREGMPWREGRVWSTDAPYRESRELLAWLHSERNIAAVDMEYSALCTVALFRHVEFAACLLVSDELWQEEWKPGFSTTSFCQRSRKLLELLIGFCGHANLPEIKGKWLPGS